MIRLNNTPNEGSTVVVNLGFRDSTGQYYIPTKIQYTLLALNNDKESWSVVDDIYKKSLTPASNVTLTIPNTETIEGTTLQRKVMVYWSAFINNQYNDFVDEITFEIVPKPYVPNPPSPQPEPEIFVKVTDVSMQLGTIDNAPVQPVFLLKTNLPVKIDNATARIFDNEGHEFFAILSVNMAGGNLTVSLENKLSYEKAYTLKISGLVSSINDYVMKEPFELSFVTCREETPPYIPVIQNNKEVIITENGDTLIEPDDGYDAIKQVELSVNVPENPILLYCYEGTIPFYFTKKITTSGLYKMFTPSLTPYEVAVTVNEYITFEYEGNVENVIREDDGDILR